MGDDDTCGAGPSGACDCEDIYNCCDCGTDDPDRGCGCAYCWSCNACEHCRED